MSGSKKNTITSVIGGPDPQSYGLRLLARIIARTHLKRRAGRDVTVKKNHGGLTEARTP